MSNRNDKRGVGVDSPIRGRPCYSEQNKDRLLRRLSAIVGNELPSSEVAKLASGNLSTVTQLSVPARQGVLALIDPSSRELGQLEQIVGSTTDYVPVAYLDRARAASVSVIRVVDFGYRPIGTGVMISKRALLTNQHVIPGTPAARFQLAQFRYELDVSGRPRATTEYRLAPDTFLLSSPVNQLDFTIVALGDRVAGEESNVAHFGHACMSASPDKHAVGDFVTLIQHPQGEYKQIALRENRVIGRGRNGTTLHYAADTLGGSSGSPVYNDQFELVALHHAGGPRNEFVLDDGRAVPNDSNEGIRISAIVQYLRKLVGTLRGLKQDFLFEILEAKEPFGHSLESESVADSIPPSSESDWIWL